MDPAGINRTSSANNKDYGSSSSRSGGGSNNDIKNKNNTARNTAPRNVELQNKNVNISAGRVFYERAASRRERHREALLQAGNTERAVALGRRRLYRSSNSEQQQQEQQKKKKKIFMDDDHVEETYGQMGKTRFAQIFSSSSSLSRAIKAAPVHVRVVTARPKRISKKQRSLEQQAKTIPVPIPKASKKNKSNNNNKNHHESSLLSTTTTTTPSAATRKKMC